VGVAGAAVGVAGKAVVMTAKGAGAVVGAMKGIEKAGLITDPPHKVPFLLGFFEKAIAVLLAQGNGQLRVPIPRQPAPTA